MKAWLRASGDGLASEDAAPQIASVLQLAGIVIDDAVTARRDDFLAQCRADEKPPDRFLIAEGKPSTPGKAGDFKPASGACAENQACVDEDPIDYRSYNAIQTVERGGIVGTVIPPEPAVVGVNVYGEAIAPDPHDLAEAVSLGKNVRRSDRDPARVLANVVGRVIYKNGVVDVVEILEIMGDIDYDSGNVYATCDVLVRGTVRDLFSVRSLKTITIGGAVEGAEIDAGQDLYVRGGIISRGKGRVVARGSVVMKFCERADVRAEGDITVGKAVIHSRLHTEGKLKVERGQVLGGSVYAREGLVVGALGSDAGVATEIIVGTHPSALKAARGEAGEPAEAAIVVNSTVHPGVTITVGLRMATFTSELGGPLRIELKKAGAAVELAATNTLTGSTTLLNSKRLDPSSVGEAFCESTDG